MFQPPTDLKADPSVLRTFTDVARAFQAQAEALKAHALSAAKAPLTPAQVTQISRSIQVMGSNPINLTGLIGSTSAGGAILSGTHKDRITNPTYAAGSVPPGTGFFETDRLALYVNLSSSNVQSWQLVCAFMTAAIASRPADLGASDDGFLFHDRAQNFVYQWSHVAGWCYAFGTIVDLLANRPDGTTTPGQFVFGGVEFKASDQGYDSWVWDLPTTKWIVTFPYTYRSQVTNSTNQVIPTSVLTLLTWDTDVVNSGGLHSIITNTGRFTIPVGAGGIPSIWTLFVQVSWGASAVGQRFVYFYKNGSPIAIETFEANAGGAGIVNAYSLTIYDPADADYFECHVFQSSGGNLNVLASDSFFGMCRVR